MSTLADARFGWLTRPDRFEAHFARAHHLPHGYDDWVYLRDSVTAAIERQFGRPPHVNVHYSGPCRLRPWEAELLSLSESQGFARQVSLQSGSDPLLLARTVVSERGAALDFLSARQSAPLGALLFRDPRFRRLSDPQPLQGRPNLVGRACVWEFLESGDRLVVEEFFLSRLVEHCASRRNAPAG